MLIKIGELARESGISVRTLRYYEEIELLVPTEIMESGYRLYGEKEALRLQQILFYREIGLPLRDIRQILDDNGFDIINSLRKQKNILIEKQTKYQVLIGTIDRTINNLQRGTKMNLEEMYEGFAEAKEHRNEAFALWGDKVKQSEESLQKRTKKSFDDLVSDFNELWLEIVQSTDLDPTSREVQSLIAEHFNFISIFWGVEESEITREQYCGLADLYANDKRFTTIDYEEYPHMGVFLKKAMGYFAENYIRK